jgi:hypothetical protein
MDRQIRCCPHSYPVLPSHAWSVRRRREAEFHCPVRTLQAQMLLALAVVVAAVVAAAAVVEVVVEVAAEPGQALGVLEAEEQRRFLDLLGLYGHQILNHRPC